MQLARPKRYALALVAALVLAPGARAAEGIEAALLDIFRSDALKKHVESTLYIPPAQRARICLAFYTEPYRGDCLRWHSDLLDVEEAFAHAIEAMDEAATQVRETGQLLLEIPQDFKSKEALLLQDPISVLLFDHLDNVISAYDLPELYRCGVEDACTVVVDFDRERYWLRNVRVLVH